jgi:hypothetical protein
MITQGQVAAKVRAHKEAHPELYCPDKRCLWSRKDGSYCPRHAPVVLPCAHLREKVSDIHTSMWDTVFVTYWCGDCRTHRTDEVIGSLARAMAEDDAESKRVIG